MHIPRLRAPHPHLQRPQTDNRRHKLILTPSRLHLTQLANPVNGIRLMLHDGGVELRPFKTSPVLPRGFLVQRRPSQDDLEARGGVHRDREVRVHGMRVEILVEHVRRGGVLQKVEAYQCFSEAIELNGHGIEGLQPGGHVAGERRMVWLRCGG